MSGYGNLIKNARSQNASNTENQNSALPETQLETSKAEEKVTNLTIKVPLALRQHWVGEAKKQGTTVTAVIIEALTKRFGTP